MAAIGATGRPAYDEEGGRPIHGIWSVRLRSPNLDPMVDTVFDGIIDTAGRTAPILFIEACLICTSTMN